MKIRIQYLRLMAFVLLFISTSCGMGRKVTITEEEIIFGNYKDGDVKSLINNLAEYPFYRNLVEDYLFTRTDYSKVSYSMLKEYMELSANDYKSYEFFDSLRIEREEEVLASLTDLSISEVGDFYRNNAVEHSYLHDEIRNSYFSDIDSLDYTSLKLLYNSFDDTDLQNIVSPRYHSLRDSLLAEITPVMNVYFDQEKQMLDDIEYSLLAYSDDFFQGGVNVVITSLMEKNNRGIMKKIFRRERMDEYSFEEYALKLINDNLNPAAIVEAVNNNMDEYLSSISRYRSEICDKYLPDDISDVNSPIRYDATYSWELGQQDINRITDVKSTATALTVGSIALAFVPGAAPLALLADVADFAYGMSQDDKIRFAMEDLTATLYNDSMKCATDYLTEIMTQIRNQRDETETKILEAIYENF